MQISVVCPSCGRQYFLDESVRGQNVACPNHLCREVFQVPADAPSTSDEPILEASDVGLVPIEEENRPTYQLPGKPKGKAPKLSGGIAYPIEDFYLTNPIARSSPTLQRCSAEILHGQTFQEAAE